MSNETKYLIQYVTRDGIKSNIQEVSEHREDIRRICQDPQPVYEIAELMTTGASNEPPAVRVYQARKIIGCVLIEMIEKYE